MNAWLCQSLGIQGKVKLLRFLEEYDPSIFEVQRKKIPHWIKLRSWEFVAWDKLQVTRDCEKLKQDVIDKSLYILRKRWAKLKRRNATTHKENTTSDHKVNTFWLLGQCHIQFHFYLRAAGLYRSSVYPKQSDDNIPTTSVKRVGTTEWKDLVLVEFERFFLNIKNSQVVIQNGKAWLSLHETEEQASSTLPLTTNFPSIDETIALNVTKILTRLIHQDGGHKVRLELLLHRHKSLRDALGGRDLGVILNQYLYLFSGMEIYREGNNWIFESKEKKSGGRMLVDKVGLYSIANTKWGNVMANTMVNTCRKLGWKNATSNDDKTCLTAVDLTASVGGMTLGLAKTRFFDKIIAVEIDNERAFLCLQNMKAHNVDDIVMVQNADAMDVIPNLSSNICVVIDPPWGGVGYKQMKVELVDMHMGKWTFQEIILELYRHCRPCLIGIRLPAVDPVKVETLFNNLVDAGIKFDILSKKKLSVQRFAVLHIKDR